MFQCNRHETIDQIHDEIHKSGVHEFSLPVKVHSFSYIIGDETKDRSVFFEEFISILDTLEISTEFRSVTGRFGQGRKDYGAKQGQIIVTFEMHSRYYEYRFWQFPGTENRDVGFGPIQCPAPPLKFCPIAKKLSSLDILITGKKFHSTQDIYKQIGSSTLYGSKILDSSIEVFTAFYPDNYDMERYLLWAEEDKDLINNIEFIVENIVRMENSYHSLLLPLPEFYEGLEKVHKLEQELAGKMDEINDQLEQSNTEQMKKWLRGLTSKMAEVTHVYEKLGHSISSTPTYEKINFKTIEQLKEKPLSNIKPLSEFLTRKTMFISTDYSSFMKRIESLGKGISDIITILRAKVDINQQEQNLKQLSNMEQSAKTQIKLQEMVEEISLIILSYYMTGLANYIFKFLEQKGVIGDSLLFTVCFIPVAFLSSYLITKRVKRIILNK
ncbi:MAG: DUF3422 family protein [Nitrospinae bacterium]|nr:DUF3422 family protein [Nitrospinota bacterium]